MKISANLGFLWTEHALPDAIRAAKTAGFDAVECHWPYDFDAADVKDALQETGLVMLGINTIRGDLDKKENGLSALVGREEEAKAAIDQALEYAKTIGAKNIHVMAGFAQGDAARNTFMESLGYASGLAKAEGIGILIEPLNQYDAPNYFLQTTAQAKSIIDEIGDGNIKLMFDCYHVQIMEGDISRKLTTLMPIIGHIQVASVPTRAEPNQGELDYRHVFALLDEIAYSAPVGIEYKPTKDTDSGLGWMKELLGR